MEKLLFVYPEKGKRFPLTCENFQRKDEGFAFSQKGVNGFIYFENVAVITAEKYQKSDDTRPNLFHIYLKGLESEQPRVVDIYAYTFKADCSEIVFNWKQTRKMTELGSGGTPENVDIEHPIDDIYVARSAVVAIVPNTCTVEITTPTVADSPAS